MFSPLLNAQAHVHATQMPRAITQSIASWTTGDAQAGPEQMWTMGREDLSEHVLLPVGTQCIHSLLTQHDGVQGSTPRMTEMGHGGSHPPPQHSEDQECKGICATREGVKEKKKPKRKEVQPLLKAGSFAQRGKEHAGTRNSLCKGAVAGNSIPSIRHLSFLPSSLAPRITGSSGQASRA